jgi:hypothetical protein
MPKTFRPTLRVRIDEQDPPARIRQVPREVDHRGGLPTPPR